MRKLIIISVFILIGLNVSCDPPSTFVIEYYDTFFENKSSSDLKIIRTTGINSILRTYTYNVLKNEKVKYLIFQEDGIVANLKHNVDDADGSKIEVYVGNKLVKTWKGPHGDYGQKNSPYNYNSWRLTKAKKPKTDGDYIYLGDYVFTITDEDLK